jgi:hypothetical protein
MFLKFKALSVVLSILDSFSVRSAATESAHVCVREAAVANRDTATGHHVHPVHERAADGPAQFAVALLFRPLQPSASSSASAAAALAV